MIKTTIRGEDLAAALARQQRWYERAVAAAATSDQG